ncbi:hypothetical protein Tco_1508108, partial [Tanacetum coccineum]
IWTILGGNGTLTWSEKAEFTIRILLAYSVGKRMLRLKIGPCRMMAYTIAENSFASVQSCQNVNRSTIDAPANALLRKYTVTRDTVL